MKKILVVDDNPANIGVLFECLEKAGFKTLVAQDGKDAIEMAENTKPDLILLDIIMPEMDGFTTCSRLKEIDSTNKIPVIFMTALTDTDNKVAGFDCGAVDYICKPFQQDEVIARINTHLTIQEQKNELLRLNREKEKMISVIAHDLRSPFNGILGLLDLLSDSFHGLTDEEKLEYIRHVNTSAKNVYQLVEELLNWVVSGSGDLEFKPKDINLFNIVESQVLVARDSASSKNIDIIIDIDSKISIYADSNMISAVIRNIVSNSVKFTRPNGSISIAAKASPGSVKIILKDTGIGMDKDVVDRISSGTKSFSSPGTDDEQGIGLGLIISREFISKNNGKLKIKSKPGRGSEFSIDIPSNQ